MSYEVKGDRPVINEPSGGMADLMIFGIERDGALSLGPPRSPIAGSARGLWAFCIETAGVDASGPPGPAPPRADHQTARPIPATGRLESPIGP